MLEIITSEARTSWNIEQGECATYVVSINK